MFAFQFSEVLLMQQDKLAINIVPMLRVEKVTADIEITCWHLKC